MSIVVVCTKCRRSFKVSEKFAGKSGPCPSCKATIQVPSKQADVQVHAPTEFAEGGRSVEGKLVTKPIARQHAKLEPVPTVAAGAATLIVLLIAWAGGRGGLFEGGSFLTAGALLLVSMPAALVGYAFVREEDLEPHRGISVLVRAAICAAAYVALWGIYGYVAGAMLSGELWEWLFVVPAFLSVGAFIPRFTFDIEYGNGFFHCAFYVLVTSLLGRIAGLGWPWEIGGGVPGT